MNILLLSDTHGHFDEAIAKHIPWADEVWHAGDIGSHHVIDQIQAIKPLKIIRGNIDGADLRYIPEFLSFQSQGLKVLMLHIAGPFGKYTPATKQLINEHSPNLLICGHSHILKVQRDDKHNLLYINPGAAGIHGFHAVCTMIRMTLSKGKIQAMDVVELGKRGSIPKKSA
jgi:putative phosphoesterase